MQIVDIAVAPGGKEMAVVNADGGRRTLSAELLWAECPSAQGRVRRARGQHRSFPADLSIVAVNKIGNYGVNIAFSDGHARGIYPWHYLDALAQRPQLQDFLTTD